jgi:hypothetical protein
MTNVYLPLSFIRWQDNKLFGILPLNLPYLLKRVQNWSL